MSTSSSACASTACCATPPAPIYGLEPSSSARRRLRSPSATTWIPATRARGSDSRCYRSTKDLGLHVCRRVHAGSARNTSIPLARSSVTSYRGAGVAQGLRHAEVRGMSEPPIYTLPPALARPRVSTYWWFQTRSICVHPARVEQRLRRVVRCLSASAGPRGGPRVRPPTSGSSTGRPPGRSVCSTSSRLVSSSFTRLPGSTSRPKAMVVHMGGQCACRDMIAVSNYAALAVVVGVVLAWLLWGP